MPTLLSAFARQEPKVLRAGRAAIEGLGKSGGAKAARTAGDVLAFAPRALNMRIVEKGLMRGEAPTTDRHFQLLVRHDVRRIVTLLDPTNPKEAPLLAAERRLARKYGIDLHHLNMPFGKDPPASSVAGFLKYSRPGQAGKTYVHCRIGRDRTGTLVAVDRIVRHGWNADQALTEMRAHGYDPERDAYLAYLGDFVKRFAAKILR